MRTFAKYLLAVIGGFLAFIALLVTSLWLIVGTPSHLAQTITRVASTAEGAIGGALLDQLTSAADASTKAAIEAKRPELEAAAGRALSAQEEALTLVLTGVVDAAQLDAPSQVDLSPVLAPVLAAMHDVDAQVPAQLDEPVTVDINPTDLSPAIAALSGLSLWWGLALLALLALIGAGLCDRRSGMRRFRVSGVTLAISSLLVILPGVIGSFATSGVSGDDPRVQVLIDGATAIMRSTILLVSGLALGIAIILIMLSIVVKPRSTTA